MPELYAQSFDLQPNTPYDSADAFSSAVQSWVGTRWPRHATWFSLGEPRALRASDGSIFRWEPFVDGTRRFIEFTWRHPHVSSSAIHWSTRVAFAVLPHRTHVSIRVSNTGPDLGQPGALATTRPRLLLTLLDHFTMRTAGAVVQSTPITLNEDDFASFVRYELFDPNRRYPIAFLSPGSDDQYVVSPEAFGRELVGIAKTYRAASAASTYALTSEIGRRELSCFHGAMRLFMPGLERKSEPRHHPLILPRRLATSTERSRVAQVLTSLTVDRFEEEAFIAHLRDERAVAVDERRSTLVTSLTKARKAAADGDDFRQLAEVYASQNAQFEQELDRLREELDESRHKIAALQHALDQRGPQSTDGIVASPILLTPLNAEDAVEQARELFPEDLLILPSALVSAADSPYRDPGEVAQALATVAEVARRLKEGKLGKKVRDVFADAGIEYSGGLSPTTPKKLRKKYVFADGEHEHVCEEHLRIGGGSYDPADSLRIYINTKDRSQGRIVVGHVGRHLDVISTT